MYGGMSMALYSIQNSGMAMCRQGLNNYGYGPFRWVCLSGKPEDLDKTDQAAMTCIDPDRRPYDRDNYVWIRDAKQNKLVVGSQARILYQDAGGRVSIALRFNEMVRNGEVSAPIMLGRDHHDPGGTDSSFRETANVKDGSNVCADMATHCFAGNPNAREVAVAYNQDNPNGDQITIPHQADPARVEQAVTRLFE